LGQSRLVAPRLVAPQFFGLEFEGFEEFQVKVALSPLALSQLNFLD
jgi:hypothetical protein